MRTRARLSALPLLVCVGCTRWAVSESDGLAREVGRRLVGVPQVERTTSARRAVEVGLGVELAPRGPARAPAARAVVEDQADRVVRVHCVQSLEITYARPVRRTPRVARRWMDLGGSAWLGVVGGGVLASALALPRGQRLDGAVRTEEALGGAMLVGAAAWALASVALLPRGAAPVAATLERRWTEVTYVEAQGCGLVPADRIDAPQPPR